MRYEEFQDKVNEQRIDEIGALIGMANWFSQKYHDVISKGAQKLGQGEVQKFTNQHLKAFMQMMGRYKVDWPTVTMYVIYQYLRLVMKLSDQDITDVVNTIIKDPKVMGKKLLTGQQIKDQNKNTLPSSFSKAGGDPAKTNQLIAQMIIAAGATRQMERHWETQAGVPRAQSGGQTTTTARQPSNTRAPQASTPSQQSTSAPSQQNLANINAALSQLGVTP